MLLDTVNLDNSIKHKVKQEMLESVTPTTILKSGELLLSIIMEVTRVNDAYDT